MFNIKKIISSFAISCCLFSYVVTADTIRTQITTEEKTESPYNSIYAWDIKKDNGQTFRCTGTIIDGNKILSAGHCLTDKEGNYSPKISAKTENFGNSEEDNLSISKENIFKKNPFMVMPGYKGYEDLKHDISVTTITEPKNFNFNNTTHLKIYKNLNQLIGKTVSTAGYSSYFAGDFTKTEGKVISVEDDGTLTVDMYVGEQNSGSPVYYNGDIIGVLTATADIPECHGQAVCSQSTVTPFTEEIKQKLFDPNGITCTVVE